MMRPNRRTLLGAMAGSGFALTAGCLGDTTEASDPEDGNESATDEEDQAESFPLSLSSVAEDPAGLSSDVELQEAVLSASAFPTVTIALENTGDDPVNWRQGGMGRDIPLPNGVYSDDGRDLLLGLDEEVSAQLMESDTGCARVDEYGTEDAMATLELEAGDRFDATYGIVGKDENFDGGCPGPGTYRFEYTYQQFDTEKSWQWGFEIELHQDSKSTNTQTQGDSPGCQESQYIDEPPHEINAPRDEEEWDSEYLGEHMGTEPSLSFDVLYFGGTHAPYTDFLTRHDGDQAYVVKQIESKQSLAENFDLDYFPVNEEDERGEWFDAIDFDESVLFLVGSGMGSGSVEHRWARIEEDEDGLHLHGYYTDPQWKDGDNGPRYSAITVEQPAESPEIAHVSLTISERCRVNFDTSDGIVVLDE